jgi:hypothetical protein
VRGKIRGDPKPVKALQMTTEERKENEGRNLPKRMTVFTVCALCENLWFKLPVLG